MWRDATAARPGVHRHAPPRPRQRPAVARRAAPPAGPRPPRPGRRGVRDRTREPATRSRVTRATKAASTSPGAEYHDLGHGDVVIAAITSRAPTPRTPTSSSPPGSSPARRARSGLTSKPWVKTSLAPGSKVVTDYFAASKLQDDLDYLGFNLVGYGCTTCIGNSRPAAGTDQRRDQQTATSSRSASSVGQPQFRRPRLPRRPRELPRLAAARRRLCADGDNAQRHGHRPDRAERPTAPTSF